MSRVPAKSSIVFVIRLATEAQRQMNGELQYVFIRMRFCLDTRSRMLDAIENLSMAIVVDQKRLGGGSHSTVGTITDIYSVLRRLWLRMPVSRLWKACECFSFNDPKGMCPELQWFGSQDGRGCGTVS